MGQKRAFKRFKLVPILVAGVIGYMLGAWNVTGLRSAGSAAETIAQRFPAAWDGTQALAATPAVAEDSQFQQATPAMGVSAKPAAAPAPAAASSGTVMSGTQFALFSPTPMNPPVPQQSPLQVASAEDLTIAPMPDAVRPQSLPAAAPDHRQIKPAPRASEIRPAVATMHRRVDRPRSVLDDAQIASIKRRLHLTPDQERMWPAVEVALRNLAYKTEQDARRRGTADDAAQLAAADPNSAEVQNLKSAAIPLIMSFNDEQKDQVRSLAYSMGLNQLASEF
jgi:hypothetical protein